MPPSTQSSLGSRVNEHDVAIAQLTTIVTELHENAKEDRKDAKEDRAEMKTLQTAITKLIERDEGRQRWSDSLRSLIFSVGGGVVMYGLVHFFHF